MSEPAFWAKQDIYPAVILQFRDVQVAGPKPVQVDFFLEAGIIVHLVALTAPDRFGNWKRHQQVVDEADEGLVGIFVVIQRDDGNPQQARRNDLRARTVRQRQADPVTVGSEPQDEGRAPVQDPNRLAGRMAALAFDSDDIHRMAQLPAKADRIRKVPGGCENVIPSLQGMDDRVHHQHMGGVFEIHPNQLLLRFHRRP